MTAEKALCDMSCGVIWQSVHIAILEAASPL